MKGFATLDTGHDSGVGMDLSGASSSTPIVSPPSWTLNEGFLHGQGHNGPGVKATIPKRTRRWLSKLQESEMDARTEAVAEAMEDDDTIDDILKMLDVSPPHRSSGSSIAPAVSAYLLELNIPSLIHKSAE